MRFRGKCPECGLSLTLKKDVGWDIDEDGEYRQHLQECEHCDKERLVEEFFDEGRGHMVLSYGKMSKRL